MNGFTHLFIVNTILVNKANLMSQGESRNEAVTRRNRNRNKARAKAKAKAKEKKKKKKIAQQASPFSEESILASLISEQEQHEETDQSPQLISDISEKEIQIEEKPDTREEIIEVLEKQPQTIKHAIPVAIELTTGKEHEQIKKKRRRQKNRKAKSKAKAKSVPELLPEQEIKPKLVFEITEDTRLHAISESRVCIFYQDLF